MELSRTENAAKHFCGEGWIRASWICSAYQFHPSSEQPPIMGFTFADWRNNIAQGVTGNSSQYTYATALAKSLQTYIGTGQIDMVGHSLGGGLAASAALATGENAVTFNAAGVYSAQANNSLMHLSFNIIA